MKIPLNRLVAFAGPYVSLIAGGVAAWAVAKANVIGIPGLGDHQNELATGLAAGATWALTAGLSHLGQMKWLRGVHIELANEGNVAAAAIAQPTRPPDSTFGALLPIGEPLMGTVESMEHEDFESALMAEGLPSDAEEFGGVMARDRPESGQVPAAPPAED